MIRRPPRSTLFPYTSSSDLAMDPVLGFDLRKHPERLLERPLASYLAGDDFKVRRSEEHTSELQSRLHLVCRLLLEKKKTNDIAKLVNHSHIHSEYHTCKRRH